MSTDPVVYEAAKGYVSAPLHPAYSPTMLDLLEIDAFIAGVEWAKGHPGGGQ